MCWSLFFNKIALTLKKLSTLIYISMSRSKSGKPILDSMFFGFKLPGLFFNPFMTEAVIL